MQLQDPQVTIREYVAVAYGLQVRHTDAVQWAHVSSRAVGEKLQWNAKWPHPVSHPQTSAL